MQTLLANPCIEWNFVNANTGEQLIDTYQMQPGSAEVSYLGAA